MAIGLIDVAYVRFSAPDLDAMQSFLEDFGLAPAGRSSTRLWMRGSGGASFVHVTELGEPGYRGFAFEAESLDALRELAEQEGVDLQSMAGQPGGGMFIRLTDPDGFAVDVVAGRAPVSQTGVNPLQDWNTSARFARGPLARRVAPNPSTVVRLGHVVHLVANVNETWNWYNARFRLTISDDVVDPDGNRAALFIRINRGKEYSDHHALNFGQFPDHRQAFHHAAFEVLDFDDLMVGKEHLAVRNRQHRWGIGRHVLGSQVFDYWSDPWGQVLEHWTDGDKFNDDEPTQISSVDTMVGRQWGPAAPAEMIS